MSADETPPPFFGGFPEHGIWSALGLTRGEFFAILATSVALFVFVDGPVWRHLHASHFGRIVVSYGVIPITVTVALQRRHAARPGLVLGASAIIALIKLVLTAGLLIAFALM